MPPFFATLGLEHLAVAQNRTSHTSRNDRAPARSRRTFLFSTRRGRQPHETVISRPPAKNYVPSTNCGGSSFLVCALQTGITIPPSPARDVID